jgi:RimJ/RimL family protein N-acetyltransferase
MIFVTERLVLRRARLDDLQDIHTVLSNAAAMRYWATPEHETLEQSRDWLCSMLGADTSRSDEFVIEHQGRVIGKAGAWMLPYLFTQHNVPRLTAEVDPRNAATIALLQRFGFTETHRAERTLKWKDEWCDSIYFALPRSAAGA